MRENLHNEKGISLVEILAAIVIMSILSILILYLLTKSTTQYNEQLNEANQLNDISYVLKIITKEIRKTTVDNIQPINNGIKINNTNYRLDNSTHTIYKYTGNPDDFSKNDEVLATNVEIFDIQRFSYLNRAEWTITIKDMKKEGVHKAKEITTTIVSRSGKE
ncbi:prepilin-type N-terminal cleavage/methylation domain-containing protein [uncultured Rummeliibacillus sp.]|uniref:prepilin-type N-terminal cleavage/methylation domain-containing protein n=1 Tax=uncultured Rummeliibacillus sp. TaxID=762292 RepID=UPI00262781FF|nr:prepilin-type N-terminal cleavage/methylation domain-containing protein [uncultured Rummeliibacillus sp.]